MDASAASATLPPRWTQVGCTGWDGAALAALTDGDGDGGGGAEGGAENGLVLLQAHDVAAHFRINVHNGYAEQVGQPQQNLPSPRSTVIAHDGFGLWP